MTLFIIRLNEEMLRDILHNRIIAYEYEQTFQQNGFDIIVDDIEHWRVAISTIISNTRYTPFYATNIFVL